MTKDKEPVIPKTINTTIVESRFDFEQFFYIIHNIKSFQYN